MKSDSYARFLRSNAYQDLLLARKKVPARGSLAFLSTVDLCLLLAAGVK